MKKFIKYSLIGVIYLMVIYFFAIMFIVTAKAELIKPKIGIEPNQVVKIQLNGLMNNDEPNLDDGIRQTWEFAHPSNKKYTGPLPKFISLLKSETYKMLINHLDNEIIEVSIYKINDVINRYRKFERRWVFRQKINQKIPMLKKIKFSKYFHK